MKLLVVNPNTSDVVTDLLVTEARSVADPATRIAGVTAPFGVAAIETPAEAAIAGHAVLQAFAEAGTVDAGIVAAFADPGLAGARSLVPFPVVGIGEASMLTACLLGRRFAVLTAGAGTEPGIRAQVDDYGLAGRFAGVRTIAGSLLGVAADQSAFEDAFADAARTAVESDGAEVVILGGAVFVGMARRMRDRVPVPLIDPIAAAVLQAEGLVNSGIWPGTSPGSAGAESKESRGLGGSLAGALGGAKRKD